VPKKIFMSNTDCCDYNVVRVFWFVCLICNAGMCLCLCVLYCALYIPVVVLVCCTSLSMECCNNYGAHLLLYDTTEVPLLQWGYCLFSSIYRKI
jgi:hypothetical protein